MGYNIADSNKTIAKNTIFLYIRMFVTLVVGLYTSRIVLRELGIVDYGINNVVGSLLALFTFIQSSLSSASSRFLAFEIGKGEDGNLNNVFCLTINIHLLFAIIVFVLCETFGLWYVYNMLVVPPDRFFAALIVYQMSVIGSMLSILVVPYNAMIIAQEHMGAFAYLSIINVLFKLMVAFILCVTPIDKLITFSILCVCFSCIVNILYLYYCNKRFEDCRYHKLWDAYLFKDMMAYSGWSIASYTPIVINQLSNVLINLFFGPVVNAARAVSSTVQQNVVAFVWNFQVALNPQIIKNYSANNMNRVFELVNISQKISFSLMFVLFLPILTNIEYFLNLWLVEVPQYTAPLVILVAISSIFLTIVNPLGVIVEAANRLKIANLITMPYYVISVLTVYMALYAGCDVITMFSIFALFDAFYFLLSLKITQLICGIPIKSQIFFYCRTLLSVVVGGIVGYFISDIVMTPFIGLVIKVVLSVIVAILIVLFMVLSLTDRMMIKTTIKTKFKFQH